MAADTGAAVALLARRAVAMQPAAEAFVQACRLRAQPPWMLAAEGDAIAAVYRQLLEELCAVGEGCLLVDEPAAVLGEHLDLITTVLGLAAGSPSVPCERKPWVMEGLGRPAARLITLRDRLRRAKRLGDRQVDDLPTGGRL